MRTKLSFLILLLFAGLAFGQLQTIGGMNGLGHSTVTCIDRDGDGRGVGPLNVIAATAGGSVAVGSQTVTPSSMFVTLPGTVTTSGSPVLTGIPNLYTLQPGQTITGTGIPANTTIVSITTDMDSIAPDPRR